MRKSRFVFIAAIFFLSLTPILAKGIEWQHLATRSVGLDVDQDTVYVGKKEGSFNRLKFGAQKKTVFINKVHVHFANGDVQTFRLNQRLSKSEVVTVDLKGKRRYIHKVVMTYKTAQPIGGRAKVQVWGARLYR